MSKEFTEQLKNFTLNTIFTIFLVILIYFIWKLTNKFSSDLGGWKYLIYIGDIILGLICMIWRLLYLFDHIIWILHELLNVMSWIFCSLVHLKILPFVSWIVKDTEKKRKKENEKQLKIAENNRREKMKHDFLINLQPKEQEQYSKAYSSVYADAVKKGQENGQEMGYEDGYIGRDKKYQDQGEQE